MVMVLCVAGVLALLRVRPATHLLQAARGVPTLNQAQGLRGRRASTAERSVGAPRPQETRGAPLPLAENMRPRGLQCLSQGHQLSQGH